MALAVRLAEEVDRRPRRSGEGGLLLCDDLVDEVCKTILTIKRLQRCTNATEILLVAS